jgi:2-keto-3-deoxy-L-rhamnonate aldolase RhmA
MIGISCGTFVKTSSHQVVELLDGAGFDFAVLDAEHDPLDRLTIDVMMVAGRAIGLPLFVRVPSADPFAILSVLDMGAAGLLVPHVDTAESARSVVASARFRNGLRGFSGSPRAAGYGQLSREAMMETGEAVTVICQIESPQAVDNVEEIAAIPGVDGLFLGRGDLSIAMGVDQSSPEIGRAVSRVGEAAMSHNKRFGMFVNGADDLARFARLGADWFVIGSDQSLLRGAARDLMRQIHGKQD